MSWLAKRAGCPIDVKLADDERARILAHAKRLHWNRVTLSVEEFDLLSEQERDLYELAARQVFVEQAALVLAALNPRAAAALASRFDDGSAAQALSDAEEEATVERRARELADEFGGA